jgi:hypothetical protein
MGDKGTGTLSQPKTITLIPAKELGLFPFEIFPDRKKGIRNLSPLSRWKKLQTGTRIDLAYNGRCNVFVT